MKTDTAFTSAIRELRLLGFTAGEISSMAGISRARVYQLFAAVRKMDEVYARDAAAIMMKLKQAMPHQNIVYDPVKHTITVKPMPA
jgi:hypothetical protein